MIGLNGWILGLYGGLKWVKWHEFSGVRGGKSNQGYGPGNAQRYPSSCVNFSCFFMGIVVEKLKIFEKTPEG